VTSHAEDDDENMMMMMTKMLIMIVIIMSLKKPIFTPAANALASITQQCQAEVLSAYLCRCSLTYLLTANHTPSHSN